MKNFFTSRQRTKAVALVSAVFLFSFAHPTHAATSLADVEALISGVNSSNHAGYSVAPAGDVNGDGYNDFLIGAYGNDDAGTSAGAAYLIYGQSSELSSTSLSTAVEFTGEVASDQAGYSVASAGDVNGDGYSDILVGAPNSNDSASYAGAAYLIYGQSSELTSASLSAAVEFTGEAENDYAGLSVSSAGDVNGDGYDDFLVGTKQNDDGGTDAGAAYLIYGQSSHLTSASLSTAVEFTGEVANDSTGGSLSAAGDVNGDGYDDFLIGSQLNDDGGTNAGAAYLIYGQSSELTSASLSTAVEFTGEVSGDQAGYSLSTAGDVNGDGYSDMVIGSLGSDDGASNAGAVYLIYGQSSDLSSASLSTAVEFTGEALNDYAGYAVSRAGDVNGDGYDDFLVGAYQNDDGGVSAGSAYLIYGQSSQLTSMSLSTTVEFTGEGVSDYAYKVAAVGDVNGDGYGDMIVGGYNNDDGGTDAGAAYLIYGQSSHLTSASLSTAVEFMGETDGTDIVGSSFASAGDVNGDGYDDFIIGSTYNDDAGTNAGAAYLIYGQSTPLTADALSTAIEFTGEAADDKAGTSVSSAGDVNGDGYDDFLVGAYQNDDGGASAGAVYLIYGQSSHLTSGSLSSAVELTGETSSDLAGNAVASAGDVNGDGYDDFLVGAYVNDDAFSAGGAAYLIYGQSSHIASGSLSTAVEFTGEASTNFAGYAVSGAGDVNGDGYDDFLVGAYFNSDADTYAGAAYLIYGQSSELTSASLSTAVEFTGEARSDWAGYSLSSAGDVNNDGYDDFLVGSIRNADAAANAGTAYLIYGQSSELTSASLSTAVEFTGEAEGDAAGNSLSPAGDVNGDGYDDFVVGAPYNSDAGLYAGAAYLIYGQSSQLTSSSLSTAVEFTGANDWDLVGNRVAAAGDVNGDGYSEVLIGGTRGLTGGLLYLSYIYIDADGDGVAGSSGLLAGTDCDDSDADLTADITYYRDADRDGLGNPSSSTSVCSLTVPDGYVSNSSDDDDATPFSETVGTLYSSLSDLQDTTLYSTTISSIVGHGHGYIRVTYSDDSTKDIHVFTKYKGTVIPKIAQYGDTSYILVLQPKGKKIALVNPYSGEVIQRVRLSKTMKYTKNSLKVLDVRHDGTLDVVVTSKNQGDLRLTLLKFNSSTGTLKKKDYETLTDASAVKVKKTKSPKKKITVKDSHGNVLYTFKVGKKFKMTLQ